MKTEQLQKLLADFKDPEKIVQLLTELKQEVSKPAVGNLTERWRAEIGEEYFYVNESGYVQYSIDRADHLDFYRWNTYNYFQTEAEAQKFADYKKEYDKKFYAEFRYREILNRDYMPEPVDWNYSNQNKFYLIRSATGPIKSEYTYNYIFQGAIYCTSEPDINKIKSEMGDDLWEALCMLVRYV